MRKQNLDLEKILEKIGSKYDAVVKMSIAANQISDGDIESDRPAAEKVTTAAIAHYIREVNSEKAVPGPVEKA